MGDMLPGVENGFSSASKLDHTPDEKNETRATSSAGLSNGDLPFDLEATGEEQGYILDVEVLKNVAPNWEQYQLTQDGRTVLIPQPTTDVDDPLNWTWTKKHIVLLVVAATSFLPDYGSATGAVTLLPQAKIWNLPEDTVNHSQVGNVFMVGAGAVVVVALSAFFGRLPILFWFTVMAVWTAAGCAVDNGFDTFMAFRILNGFFSTVAQGGGMMFIKDMFFVHERARKINIWASFVILSPYAGPLIAAFIIEKHKWELAFQIYTIMTALCLLAIIFLGDETFYHRKIAAAERPVRQRGVAGQISRLVGVEQFRTRHLRNTFVQACMRSVHVMLKPTVFISCVWYLFVFAWVVGINTCLSMFVTPLYNFGPRQIGFFYFTPIIAATIGEIVGRWLHDFLADWHSRRSPGGRLKPEYRLTAITFATPFMVVGIIVLGFALEEGYHYMVAALGWGLFVFGIMVSTVAITSYNLDCYPEGSGEVAAWLNFARTAGGFIISYFQVRWANAMGTKKSLGIQAAVVFTAWFLILFLQVFGEKLRKMSGPLRFKTD